jgi:membrane protein
VFPNKAEKPWVLRSWGAGEYLWSANAGIKAVFDALNATYQEREKRGFFRLNAVSLSFTLFGILLVVLALAAMVVLPRVLADIADATAWIVEIGRWPVLLLAVGIAIDLVYRSGPSREKAKWRWLTWGSAFAVIAWLLMSLAFTWYAASFGRFNETYGSLGAVIGFMIWLWLSNVVLLIGAQINAEIEHRSRRNTTTGSSKPMGKRGAKRPVLLVIDRCDRVPARKPGACLAV